MTRLNVQEDDLGNVVRLLIGDPPEVIELSPTRAQEVGERLQAAGESVHTPASKFAGDPDEEQSRLDEVGNRESQPFRSMLEEAETDPPEIGEIINSDDPLEY